MDVSGIEALSTIKVKSLIMKNCALGPKATMALAAALSSDSMAVLELVDLSNNKFDPALLKDIKDIKLNIEGCRP